MSIGDLLRNILHGISDYHHVCSHLEQILEFFRPGMENSKILDSHVILVFRNMSFLPDATVVKTVSAVDLICDCQVIFIGHTVHVRVPDEVINVTVEEKLKVLLKS